METVQWVKVTILCNQQVQTDITIPNNKPDIIIRDTEQRKCVLIDVAISGDRNVIKKEAERILKYKDLTIETQRMCNVKTTAVPVTTGALGTISKPFRKYVSTVTYRTPRSSGTAENSYFRHCTHPPESADVEELQN